MVKSSITVFVLCLIIAVSMALLNAQLLTTPPRFSLNAVYAFHGIATFIVYILVAFTYQNLPSQSGYAYLTTVFVKMGIFVLMFKDAVFTGEALTKPERFSLFAPLFVFLIMEAILVAKLLNSKQE